MLSEKEIQKIYDEQVAFLKICDQTPKEDWNIERYESYECAIAVYETLHKILEIPGDPKWVS
jgi:hypothetical protein